MTDFTVGPDPVPPRREAAREYLLDMLQQLSRMARATGDLQIAILLEAILAADKVAKRPN